MLEAKGLTECYASVPAVYLWQIGPAVLGISKLFLKFREDELNPDRGS